MNSRYADYGLLILRMFFGLALAYHGYGKVFGGYMDKFAGGVAALGFPAPHVFAWLAALSEFAGGIFVAIGFGSCIPPVFISFTMAIAAFGAHGADTFDKKELPLAFMFVALTLIMTGNGRFSLDRLICRRRLVGGEGFEPPTPSV